MCSCVRADLNLVCPSVLRSCWTCASWTSAPWTSPTVSWQLLPSATSPPSMWSTKYQVMVYLPLAYSNRWSGVIKIIVFFACQPFNFNGTTTHFIVVLCVVI